jgi:hypothetical protein
MVTGDRDPQGGYSPEPGSEGFKKNELSVKLPLPSRRGRRPAGPMTTLRYNPTALEPFLSKQNDDINQFLVALGVPDNGQNGPYPFELLTTSEIEYLVDMLNKKFGTTFSYDDVDMLLIDAGPDDDDDEDAEDADEGDQAMSDRYRTQTELVYSLIRDLAAENPGKDPAGYLQVFSTYSAFVKRAKNLINRIDGRPQR